VAVIRRVLDGVGQEIQQDLLDTLAVADDPFFIDVEEMDIETVAFLFQVGLDHGEERRYQVAEVDFFLGQDNTATFDFGHIEHFVDQGKQQA